jgi:hypothetical protein
MQPVLSKKVAVRSSPEIRQFLSRTAAYRFQLTVAAEELGATVESVATSVSLSV